MSYHFRSRNLRHYPTLQRYHIHPSHRFHPGNETKENCTQISHTPIKYGYECEWNYVLEITWKTNCSVSMFSSICMRKSMAKKTAVTKTGNVTLQFHANFVKNKNDFPNAESIILSGCEKSRCFDSRNKFEYTVINSKCKWIRKKVWKSEERKKYMSKCEAVNNSGQTNQRTNHWKTHTHTFCMLNKQK